MQTVGREFLRLWQWWIVYSRRGIPSLNIFSAYRAALNNFLTVGSSVWQRNFTDYRTGGAVYWQIYWSFLIRHYCRQVNWTKKKTIFYFDRQSVLFFWNDTFRYGRKTSVTLASILYIVWGPVSAFVNTYWLFLIGRICLGLAGSGVYHSSYTICKCVMGSDFTQFFFVAEWRNFIKFQWPNSHRYDIVRL